MCAQYAGWANYASSGSLLVRLSNKRTLIILSKRSRVISQIFTVLLVKRDPSKAASNLTAALKSRAEVLASISSTINEANQIAGHDDLSDVFMTVDPPPYELHVRADDPSGENHKPVRVLSLGECHALAWVILSY